MQWAIMYKYGKTYEIQLLLLPLALRTFQIGLGFLIIDTHSSLFNAFVLHLFTPSLLKSSSTSFNHLNLGRPLPLLPSNFPSKIFFTDLVSFILLTCPSYSNLRIFITVTIWNWTNKTYSCQSVFILNNNKVWKAGVRLDIENR